MTPPDPPRLSPELEALVKGHHELTRAIYHVLGDRLLTPIELLDALRCRGWLPPSATPLDRVRVAINRHKTLFTTYTPPVQGGRMRYHRVGVMPPAEEPPAPRERINRKMVDRPLPKKTWGIERALVQVIGEDTVDIPEAMQRLADVGKLPVGVDEGYIKMVLINPVGRFAALEIEGASISRFYVVNPVSRKKDTV